MKHDERMTLLCDIPVNGIGCELGAHFSQTVALNAGS